MKRWTVILLLIVAHGAPAQEYRLRLDTRVQTVAFRGVEIDSVPLADVVAQPDGSLVTADGFAVDCAPGSAWCMYFRPGAVVRGSPLVTTASATVWGLGVTGLSVRATGRLGSDLRDDDAWPGTDPGAELVEAYAEWARRATTIGAGRMFETSRLGFVGFDGGRAEVRAARGRLRGSVWGGWGLARASAYPATDPANDPFGEFLPERRQHLLGFDAEGHLPGSTIRALLQREVDPRARDFVSERAGIEATARALGVRVRGGADYDVAAGFWGSAEAAIAYVGRPSLGSAEVGARRYRPHFALWTIWGAFSPVPYRAAHAAVALSPHRHVSIRARGEVYEYDDTGAITPLVVTEDSGWRWRVDAAYPTTGRLRAAFGWLREFGPGASASGWDGGVTTELARGLTARGSFGQWLRPLELRYGDAELWAYGVGIDWTASPRLSFSADGRYFDESRDRPDAAAFDWSQWRVSLGATLHWGSGIEQLPDAISRIPMRGGS